METMSISSSVYYLNRIQANILGLKRCTPLLDTGTFITVQFSSVAQSCLTLCNPMDHSTPGFPVHHQLLEFTQTHVHRVGDAIQSSHPLSSPSPPALNLSQHQGLFKWVSSSHQVAKVLEFQLQHQSFQLNTQDWSPLGWAGWTSLLSKGLSRVFSNTTVQNNIWFHNSLYYVIMQQQKNWSWEEIMPFAWESKSQIGTFLLTKTIN